MNAALSRALDALTTGAVPTPPPEAMFVGDGDFHAIGAEYLAYFVEVGGLLPTHRVLDIGCGIGRMAAALSGFLDPDAGRYLGLDPVGAGIAWCRGAFAAYPHFAFVHADIDNALYNPGGAIGPGAYRLPAADRTVDFAVLTSVFTHLYEDDIAAYWAELARVMAPGGRVFATAFLYEPPSPAEIGPVQHLHFTRQAEDNPHRWHAEGLPPLAAVAYAEPWFKALAGERLGRPVEIRPGRWRGGAGPWFQDLVLA